jgi:hypothetical protein
MQSRKLFMRGQVLNDALFYLKITIWKGW